MIGCDMCEEWFHGPCVGYSEDTEQVSSQQDYICIGCASAFKGFDPYKEDTDMSQEPHNEEINELNEYQLFHLKLFSQVKRIDIQFFRNIIREGIKIPLYLEELQELKAMHSKIQNWLCMVQKALSIPLSITKVTRNFTITRYMNPELSSCEEYSSSSSDLIICTMVNQSSMNPSLTQPIQSPDDQSPLFCEDQVGNLLMKLFLEREEHTLGSHPTSQMGC